MALFNYKATDEKGLSKVGSVQARNQAAAVSLLRDQGLFVVEIVEKRVSILDSISFLSSVSETEVVAFTRQFSTMISAGLPLSRALEVLAGQTENKTFKKNILDILRDVEGGSTLSSAMAKVPRVFSPTFQSLVRAGEASGKLEDVLNRLADTLESQRELRSKFKSAMIYPTIVFVAMIGVFILMMIMVIPKLADMYKSLNVDLPPVTQFMITMSDFFVNYLYFVLFGAAGFIFGIRYFLQTDGGKDLLSYITFKIPVFGKINKQKELTEFTRTLSLLIGSAIPLVEALRIVSNVVTNNNLRLACLEAARYVEKGNTLSEYLIHNKLFPPLLGQMATVGEETGQLDETFGKVADFFEAETNHAVEGLSAALEPIILILLGSMVGVLIVSIITPIYKITSAI